MSKKITCVTKHKTTTQSIINTTLGILITLAMSASLFATPETAYAGENKVNSCIAATQKSDNSTKIIVAGSWFDGVKNFWKSVFKDKNKDGKKDEKSDEKGKKDENSKKHIEVVDEDGLTAEERNKAKSDSKKSKKKQTRKKKKNRKNQKNRKNRKNKKRKNSKNGIKRKKKATTRKRKRVNRKRKNSVKKVLRSNTNRNTGNNGDNGNNGDASKNAGNDSKQNQNPASAPAPVPAQQQQQQQQVQTPAPAPTPQQQTPQNSGAIVVHPGSFCNSGPGVEAVSPKGVPMVCSDTGEGRTRWRRR